MGIAVRVLKDMPANEISHAPTSCFWTKDGRRIFLFDLHKLYMIARLLCRAAKRTPARASPLPAEATTGADTCVLRDSWTTACVRARASC